MRTRRYQIPRIPYPARRCPPSALYSLPIFLASRPFASQSRSQADSWICVADALTRANPFDDAENGQPTPFRLYITRALSDSNLKIWKERSKLLSLTWWPFGSEY